MEQLKLKQGHQLDLMKAMKFSEKDLAANRQGLLSNAQRNTLRLRQWWGALGWWLLVGIGTLVLLSSGQWSTANSLNRLTCLVVILIGLGMAFWRQEKVSKILRHNRVAVVTGAIIKTHQFENSKALYQAFVGPKTFRINRMTYDCLQEGEEYHVYCLAEMDELLSIELFSTGDAGREKQKRLEASETDIEAEALTAEEVNFEELSR
jgi:hypothetical protein